MDWTPPKLLMECESADKLRDNVIGTLDVRLARYFGPEYGFGNGEYWPENYYYTWVSYILPQIIFQNPRVKIGSLRLDEVADEAKALEIALNRWIKDTNHRQVLKQLGLDMGFAYGVSLTRPVPMPGGDTDDPPWRPQVTRLNQRLFSMDPMADGPEDARYMNHVSIDDRDRMIEWAKEHKDEGWNLKAIESAGGIQAYDLTKSPTKDVPDRGQIAYREIWCPEVNDYLGKDDDPESYHGTIYTMALHPSREKSIEWLRDPRPFMGPRTGPYTIFGAHRVPGCPYPLGPLVANGALFEESNALELANYESARNRKNLVLYDKTNESEAAAMMKAQAWAAIGITGFEKSKVEQVELGGVTEQGMAQSEHVREAAKRALGVNEIQQGGLQAAGDPLATEVLQAQAASNVRVSDLSEEFAHAEIQQLSKVAFYMLKFDKVSQPLTNEDKQALGIPVEASARFTGKDNKLSMEQMELEVEPYSMKRSDEASMQARAMQAITLASTVGPLVPQTPWIRWKPLFEKLGDSMNWPGFAEILDEDVAAQATAMIAQQMQAKGQPQTQSKGGPSAQPRLQGDLTPPKPPAQGFASPANARQKPSSKPMSKPKPVGAGGTYK